MTTNDILDTLFDAWSAHDALRAAACFAPDGVYQEAGGDEIAGREAISAHFSRFFREGPPWRFDVDDVIAEGSKAAVTYRFSVKGDGDGWHERGGCAVVHFADGLVRVWHEYHG